jgi:hypothetical protein
MSVHDWQQQGQIAGIEEKAGAGDVAIRGFPEVHAQAKPRRRCQVGRAFDVDMGALVEVGPGGVAAWYEPTGTSRSVTRTRACYQAPKAVGASVPSTALWIAVQSEVRHQWNSSTVLITGTVRASTNSGRE